MKKIYLMLFVILLVTIPLVSAFQFDNIKGGLQKGKGISEYGKVEIRNSVFGWEWFQLDKVMSLELKENTELCPSTGCSAKQEIIMYEDGKLIDSVRFIDLKTGAGTSIKSYEIYVNGDLYNGEEVSGYSKGVKYDVELRGKLYPFQEVDWQIKSAGTDWIDDWAAWSWNTGLVSYWDFEETSGDLLDTIGSNDGTVVGALREQPGLLGDAYTFNGSTDYVNFTFKPGALNGTLSFWVNFSGGGNPAIAGHDHGGYNSDFFLKIAGGTEIIDLYMDDGVGSDITIHSNSAIPTNVWVHVLMVWGGNGLKIYVNGTAQTNTSAVTYIPNSTLMIGAKAESTGFGNPFNGSIDETAYWERALTPSEISDLYDYYTLISPMVLNSPIDGYNTTTKDITFNCSFDIGYELNISNVSLYHNASGTFTLNQTNITLVDTNSTTVIFNAPFVSGSYEWNCYGCDNTSSCSWGAENRTFTRKRFVVDNENYSQVTTEGNVETFYINITTADLSITSANLTYNSTNYPAVFTQSGYEFYVLKTINIPQVTSSKNLTFNWNFELSDSSTVATDSHNQSVLSLNMDNCSTYTYHLFNITLRDEEDQSKLDGATQNTSIKLEFTISTLDNIKMINYSTFFNLTNPATVCLESSLNQSSLRLDGLIEYSSLGRFTEFYYFQNYSLDGTTTDLNISLYNLNSSDGQEFKITYKDANFVPIEGAIMDIQRKYVDEGVFKTTERPKTGTEGYTIGHLVINDIIYNIIIYKEGKILASFNDIVADCQNPALTSCSINLNSYGTSILPESFATVNDISFTLTYNKTTREVASVFTILSGATSSVNLDINLFDSLGETPVCNDTIYASGGAVSCIVPLSFGNSTVVAKLNKNGDLVGQSVIRITPDPSDIYGNNLIYIALIAFITLIGIGISDDPKMMGVMLVVGIIVLVGLNLIYTPAIVGVGATVLWFVVAVVIILIKGSNRQ